MLNATIVSLSVLSMMYSSPFYLLSNTHQKYLKSTFINSHFTHFFSNVFLSTTQRHETSFQNCLFSQILDSSIKLNEASNNCFIKTTDTTDNSFEYGKPIENKIIEKRSYFTNSCGNITITGCIFNGCRSYKSYGGSLDIEQKCFVLIHNTIFNNSTTDKKCGGACYIVKSQGSNKAPDFDDSQLPQLDVQYCCFQNCYGNNNLYGVALFAASKKTMLYFTSTVNCPGFQRPKSSGAQFDIQSYNITSKFINATQGNSVQCAGIEYRYASKGFFKFQTISDMACMFAISFKNTDTDDIDLSYSNIFNISLIMPDSAKNLPNFYPGVIYVENTDKITVDHFCFFKIDFGLPSSNSKLISRGTETETHNNEPIKIVLIDCTFDCPNSDIAVNISPNVNNQKLIRCKANTVKSNTISYLNLGDCKGDVTPMAINSETKDKNKTKIALIAGIAGGIGLLLIIAIIVIIVVVVKKRKTTAVEDLEMHSNGDGVFHQNNPLYDMDAEDDPFKDDFMEQ